MDFIVVEVEDDGVGIVSPARGQRVEPPQQGTGIGMANVRERLKVLYSDAARVEMESRTGAGTIVRIVMPVPQSGDMAERQLRPALQQLAVKLFIFRNDRVVQKRSCAVRRAPCPLSPAWSRR